MPDLNIEEAKSYCDLCLLELKTDFEKDKGQHWECHKEMQGYSMETLESLEFYNNLNLYILNRDGNRIQLDMPNLVLQQTLPITTIQEAQEAVITIAKDKWSLYFEGMYPRNGFGITALRPEFIGLHQTNWYVKNCMLENDSWYLWKDHTVDINLYIMIVGVFNLSKDPSITEIKFTANGIQLPIINFEQMYYMHLNHIFFSKPFIISPENNLRIYLRTSNSSINNSWYKEKFGLIGYAIGKRKAII